MYDKAIVLRETSDDIIGAYQQINQGMAGVSNGALVTHIVGPLYTSSPQDDHGENVCRIF